MKRAIQFVKDTVVVWLLLAFALGYIANDTPELDRKSLSTAAAYEQPETVEPAYKYIDGKRFDLSDKAWYTTYGKSFHTSRTCGQLTKSSNIEPTSTIGEAIKAGKGDPCDFCAFD